jgi:hypothetical protein
LGLRNAVSSIVDRSISWIEHDRQRKTNAAAPSLLTQDMMKQSPQSSTYSGLANSPANSGPNQRNGPDSSVATGPANSGMASSRNNYYGETTPDASAYPPIPYNDASTHAPSNMAYNAENPYMYAQANQVPAAQVQAQAQAQVHAHAQAQVQQTQASVADHNPLSSFATQATQISQPSADIMWRQETTGGNTWHDWTAAVVDNQDRYNANALISLGAGARPNSVVNDHGSNAADLGMGAQGMNGANVPTTANMQWPLLLFHDGPGVGGS